VRRAFLCLEQEGKTIHYPVKILGITLLGRSERNDIAVSDTGASGSHCRIEHRPDGFFVFDLASTNGTFVNGHRVEKSPIEHGDRLRLGRTTFRFLIEKTHSPFGRL
jgi:pSer/pThr/pTyr-binding forkhead associated (FHA) protein